MKLHDLSEPLEATQCDLSRSHFSDVKLAGATFQNMDMSNWQVEAVNLANLKLANATLTNATIQDIDMSNWRVEDVNLAGLKLTNANLTNAVISNCTVEGATLDGIPIVALLAAWRQLNP